MEKCFGISPIQEPSAHSNRFGSFERVDGRITYYQALWYLHPLRPWRLRMVCRQETDKPCIRLEARESIESAERHCDVCYLSTVPLTRDFFNNKTRGSLLISYHLQISFFSLNFPLIALRLSKVWSQSALPIGDLCKRPPDDEVWRAGDKTTQ